MVTLALKRKSKAFKRFWDEEWAVADKEHYGKVVEWQEKKLLLKLTDRGKIIGTLTGKIEAGVAYIGSIIIAKDKREQGLGAKLMKEAEKIAKKFGAHKIYLVTGKDWEAVSFYRSLGYQVTAKLPNHYMHKDFIEMTKFL